jgi:hypothetical protein
MATEALAVKFLWHLAVASLAVTVVVVGAVIWAHTAGTGGGGVRQIPSQQVIIRFNSLKAAHLLVRSDNGFDLSNTQDLIRTSLIEAVLAAAVITIGAVRRQVRRARRNV